MNFIQTRVSLNRLIALTATFLLMAAIACVPPSRPDYSPDDEVDDSGSGPPLGDDDDAPAPPPPSAADDDDAAGDDDDDDDVAGNCDEDEVVDCDGGCASLTCMGDDFCDSYLDCAELFFDNGDCAQ
jgi:hypothetical protein